MAFRRTPARVPALLGQATLEFALLLPALMLIVMFSVQVFLLTRDQMMLLHAARVASRAVAISNDPSLAQSVVVGSTQLDPHHLTVSVLGDAQPGEEVTLRLEYRSQVAFALFRLMVEEVVIEEELVMRAE